MKKVQPRKTLYVCDPAKANECSKTACVQNENDIYPVCELTSHKEWAALNNVEFTTYYADNVPYRQEVSFSVPFSDWFELESQPFFLSLMGFLRKKGTQENNSTLGAEID